MSKSPASEILTKSFAQLLESGHYRHANHLYKEFKSDILTSGHSIDMLWYDAYRSDTPDLADLLFNIGGKPETHIWHSAGHESSFKTFQVFYQRDPSFYQPIPPYSNVADDALSRGMADKAAFLIKEGILPTPDNLSASTFRTLLSEHPEAAKLAMKHNAVSSMPKDQLIYCLSGIDVDCIDSFLKVYGAQFSLSELVAIGYITLNFGLIRFLEAEWGYNPSQTIDYTGAFEWVSDDAITGLFFNKTRGMTGNMKHPDDIVFNENMIAAFCTLYGNSIDLSLSSTLHYEFFSFPNKIAAKMMELGMTNEIVAFTPAILEAYNKSKTLEPTRALEPDKHICSTLMHDILPESQSADDVNALFRGVQNTGLLTETDIILLSSRVASHFAGDDKKIRAGVRVTNGFRAFFNDDDWYEKALGAFATTKNSGLPKARDGIIALAKEVEECSSTASWSNMLSHSDYAGKSLKQILAAYRANLNGNHPSKSAVALITLAAYPASERTDILSALIDAVSKKADDAALRDLCEVWDKTPYGLIADHNLTGKLSASMLSAIV